MFVPKKGRVIIVGNKMNTCELLFMDNLHWYSFLCIDTCSNYIYFCLQYLCTYAKLFCQIAYVFLPLFRTF